MSSCRIERKRAHDREAQRASRAKTKAKIEHLEKTVKDLTEASGNNRANYLAQHASQQAQEIDTLQNLVAKIRTLINDTVKADAILPSITAPPAPKSEDTTSPDSATEFLNGAHDVKNASNSERSESPNEDYSLPEATKAKESEVKPMGRPTNATRNLNVLGVNLQLQNNDDRSFSSRLNRIIEKVEQTPDDMSTIEEDQDILVRAIVFGWDAAERVHHFDIGWRFIRAFDEGMWYRAAPVERFAHTWVIRNTLVHKVNPKNQKPRPLATMMLPTIQQQASLGHPPLADYFVWPDIRNHIVANGITSIPGKSTVAFAENFRFIWPYELRDMYKVNKTTGLFELSEQFWKSWNNLSNYQMQSHHLLPPFSRTLATPKGDGAREGTKSGASAGRSTDSTVNGLGLNNHNVSNIMQDVADWMSPFSMDMVAEAGSFGMDSYTLAQEIGLAQWPAI